MERWSLSGRLGFLRLKSCKSGSSSDEKNYDRMPNLLGQRVMGQYNNVMTAKFDLNGLENGQEVGFHISAQLINAIGVKKDSDGMHLFFFENLHLLAHWLNQVKQFKQLKFGFKQKWKMGWLVFTTVWMVKRIANWGMKFACFFLVLQPTPWVSIRCILAKKDLLILIGSPMNMMDPKVLPIRFHPSIFKIQVV